MIDYFAGLVIYKAGDRQALRKLALIVSMVMNLSLLGFFKYSNFIIENINNIFGTHYGSPTSLLPIGISFFTFQSMSYTIDLYRKNISVQKNPITFAAFVTLFPQIVAGPIVRYEDVAAELDERVIDIDLIWDGLLRFAVGLGKKVLIANNIGVVWTNVKAMNLSELPVATAWLGIAAYTLQIYFDFSGYSDMAIGLGKMFGFSFLENFNYPLISSSITDFWRRWHISLSSWFRDYVYIPLGGNRVSKFKWIRNIMIVWFLTGFWHGASWNFIIWGMYFGFILLIEKLYIGKYLKKTKVFKYIYSLLIIIIGFLIFNTTNVSDIINSIKNMFLINKIPFYSLETLYYLRSNLVLLIVSILAATPLFKNIVLRVKKTKFKVVVDVLEPIVYIVLLTLCTAFLIDASFNPFLYFRF